MLCFKRKDFVLGSKNKAVQEILEISCKAAASDLSILILGESGTGKEVLARYIHEISSRNKGHFVPINCHVFTEGLLESEFFGHEKGAFTGAIERRIGRFEEANEGTLFLDEIGDMPLSTQIKLLRAIETKSIERIGSNKCIPVDLRFISVTNRDICKTIEIGDFREDLYYRINAITIEIPPLRDRREDLPIDNKTINLTKLQNHTISSLRDARKDFEINYIQMVLDKYDGNITEASKHLEITTRQLYNKISEYDLKQK